MSYQKGQVLVELIVAIGIFIVIVSSLLFLVLNSYETGRLAAELTQANFLAEEGLEATRSIRDNSWDGLIEDLHGLAISLTGNWIFQGSEEDISDQLRAGAKRTIHIETIDLNTKRITSNVNWYFTEDKLQGISLVTYLSNWQRIFGIEIRKPTAFNDFPSGNTANDANAFDYPDGTTYAATAYDITRDPSIVFYSWETTAQSYSSLVLKYRYHAEGGTNDTYAVAYSTTGCDGTFTVLVPPTSAFAPDTTISANLFPDQDLSLICVKIYSQRVGPRDRRSLYTRDIWTEGNF